MSSPSDSQPFDERHNVNPFRGDSIGNDTQTGFALPERGKAQSYHPGGLVVPENMTYSRIWPSVSGPGLHFIAADAVPFTDMARTLTEPDQLENVHEVDLRTMLAHLDSVARAITRELEARGLGGRR